MSIGLRHLIAAMAPQAGEIVKPAWRQLREIVALKVKRNIGPRYYLSARLNQVDVAFEDAQDHVNESEYLAFIKRINPPARRRPYDSKLLQKQLLAARGIPTPTLLSPIDGQPADAASLSKTLSSLNGSLIAVKPPASSSGRGFHALKVRVTGQLIELVEPDTATTMTLSEFSSMLAAGYIAETYVQQQCWYARLNKTSVNTWRIWAIKTEAQAIEIVLAYLRMGRAGARVDNMGAGGLFAPLRDDGTLGPAQDGTICRRTYAAHPDSGCPVLGVRAPFTDEARALAASALAAMPDLAFAGVDVAVTPAGPTIIEINAEPDRMGAARTGLPFARWLSEHSLR